MALSVFDLFSIGIGPSSSHTVGPMRAAKRFVASLQEQHCLTQTHTLEIELFGSLGLTGRGHGTDNAIILGLLSEQPETVVVETIPELIQSIKTSGHITLGNSHRIGFCTRANMIFHKSKQLEFHPNGMTFKAFNENKSLLHQSRFYSTGGGFVVSEAESQSPNAADSGQPFPFTSGAQLLAHCQQQQCSIAEIILKNETIWRSPTETKTQLLALWDTMAESIEQGCHGKGALPGGLNIPRRAPKLYQELMSQPERQLCDQLSILDWVNVYALAVSEENAAGGRVVTAPTNGAAGIIPAVLMYMHRFCKQCDQAQITEFLLTAAAVGMLYKKNASISGAEVGCQGEVGVACSMAAAGLTAAMGGSPSQAENAAEIGMEHHLGMTCDPIGGLVQIPCIERNAMGAIKAINAQRIAIRGDGHHYVSLDKVIRTMQRTGEDMQSKYRETSRGGLAVNVVEC